MRQILVPLLLTALALPTAASAKSWVTDYTQSSIGFSGSQGGQKFSGHFSKFQISINLDPAKPATGEIKALIDITSATTGNADMDTYLQSHRHVKP